MIKNNELFEDIDILHTGDIHSHLENYPQIKQFLNCKKRQYQNLGHSVYSFDLGDMIDRFNPITEVSQGKQNVLLANNCQYDAVTIGNNEGLTLRHDELNTLYDDANYQVVISNLKAEKSETPNFAHETLQYVTKLGTKIGVLAITAPYQLTYPKMQWEILDINKTLNLYYDKLRAENDVLILLSHLGKKYDLDIANRYKFDLILGSHTHHYFSHGEYVNNCLITALGRYGEYVGHIKLKLVNHKVVEKSSDTYETKKLAYDKEDQKLVDNLVLSAQKSLKQETVCLLPHNLDKNQQVLDCLEALANYGGCSVAMISTGMFLNDLKKGVLSKDILLNDLPHSVHPAKYKLLGKKLLAFLNYLDANKELYLHKRIHGMGFRGNVFGQMCYKGITKVNNDYYFENKLIDETMYYEFVSLDHYYFLPYFEDLQDQAPEIYQDCFLRELMEKYYQEKFQ